MNKNKNNKKKTNKKTLNALSYHNIVNPFMQSGLFYFLPFYKSNSNERGVWIVFNHFRVL